MISICKKCNVSFCDCPDDLPVTLPEIPKPVRHISKIRSREIQRLIDEVTNGEISKDIFSFEVYCAFAQTQNIGCLNVGYIKALGEKLE